jgi:hypothetical protein
MPIPEEPPSEEEGPDHTPFDQLTEKHSDLVIEVLLRMLDWMGVCKSTWASAEGVWDMLRSMVPEPADYPVFSHVKRKLEEYMDGRMEIIPICVNNCMAFYNCKSSGFSGREWQTADDNFCRHCGEDRWLRESIHAPTGTNRKVPLPHLVSASEFSFRIHIMMRVQVMYYLPVRHFVRDTWKVKDLADHLRNDTVGAEPGSLKNSRGWAEKMTNNPLMYGRRDLALVGMSDGVPYFKDKTKRSGTAAFLRHGNLPEGMALQNRNCHMAVLQPSVFLSWCPKKKKGKKVHRNPKNQAPMMTVLCDELYDLQVRGVECTDYSMPVGTPGRVFVCRCCLLLW